MNIETLKKFVSKDENRKVIYEPFNQGDYTYATDDRILLRVKRIDEFKERDTPAITSKDFPFDATKGNFVKLPDVKTVEIECGHCKGYGYFSQCPRCHGDGEIECLECGNIYTCPSCRGNAVFKSTETSGNKCKWCDGTGKVIDPNTTTRIGNAHFADKYLALIGNNLSDVLIQEIKDNSNFPPALFMFDGGMGYLMQMVKLPK